jgi:hypothetical protein
MAPPYQSTATESDARRRVAPDHWSLWGALGSKGITARHCGASAERGDPVEKLPTSGQ